VEKGFLQAGDEPGDTGMIRRDAIDRRRARRNDGAQAAAFVDQAGGDIIGRVRQQRPQQAAQDWPAARSLCLS